MSIKKDKQETKHLEEEGSKTRLENELLRWRKSFSHGIQLHAAVSEG